MNPSILQTRYVSCSACFNNRIILRRRPPLFKDFTKQFPGLPLHIQSRAYRKQYSKTESTTKLKADFYSALRISPKATAKQIKTAYYKLCLIYHPDKNNGTSESKEKFAAISEAYKALSDEESRMKYDRTLASNNHHMRNNESHARFTSAPSKHSYDEWTRAHYGTAFKQRKIFLKKRQEFTEEMELLEKRKLLNRRVLPILSVLSITVLLISFCTST